MKKTIIYLGSILIFVALSIFFVACGNGGSDVKKPPDIRPSGDIPLKSGSGMIAGRVMLARHVPAPQPKNIFLSKDADVCGLSKPDPSVSVKDGGIENVVVWIEGMLSNGFSPFNYPVLDQRKCEFKPHVIFARAGKEITVQNSDDVLHNFHTYSKLNPPLNIAQPKFKKEIKVKFEKSEIIKIGCDVHGWMHGVLVIMDHPYYTVTDGAGEFRFLRKVSAGKHVIKAWHEKLGELSQEVLVESGKTTEIVFEYNKIP